MLDANLTLMNNLSSGRSRPPEPLERVYLYRDPLRLWEREHYKSGTYIEGPCIIGKNCRIGPHAYIRGATIIGDDCHIGHCSELKNSIIMNGTKIPHYQLYR